MSPFGRQAASRAAEEEETEALAEAQVVILSATWRQNCSVKRF